MEFELTGKTVVVTGANSGVGFVTAAALATRGAHVVLACRNLTKAQAAVAKITAATPGAALDIVRLDLGDLDSVASCAAQLGGLDRLDVLVNNAGAIFLQHTVNQAGIESTFAVNYLGHYVLTRLLLPQLLVAPHPRVVLVASAGHRMARSVRWDDLSGTGSRYAPLGAYGQAKLAEIQFVQQLARRYGARGLGAAAVHPGLVASEFYRNAVQGTAARFLDAVMARIATAAETAAQSTIRLASGAGPLRPNGAYWSQGRPVKPSRSARDPRAAHLAWEQSAVLTAASGIALPD